MSLLELLVRNSKAKARLGTMMSILRITKKQFFKTTTSNNIFVNPLKL